MMYFNLLPLLLSGIGFNFFCWGGWGFFRVVDFFLGVDFVVSVGGFVDEVSEPD